MAEMPLPMLFTPMGRYRFMKPLRIAAVILLGAASGPALAGRTVATAPAPAIAVPAIGFTERTLPNGLRLSMSSTMSVSATIRCGAVVSRICSSI
jgi:hypothetical protein